MKNLPIFVLITLLFAVACKKEEITPPPNTKTNPPTTQTTNDTVADFVTLDVFFNQNGNPSTVGTLTIDVNGVVKTTKPYTLGTTYSYTKIPIGTIKKNDVVNLVYDKGVFSNGTNIAPYDTVFLAPQFCTGTLNAIQLDYVKKGQLVKSHLKSRIFVDSTSSGKLTVQPIKYQINF